MGNWRETTNLGVGSGTESVDYSYTSELHNAQSFWSISHTKISVIPSTVTDANNKPCRSDFVTYLDRVSPILKNTRQVLKGRALKGETSDFIYDFLPKV